ncbi:antirestriction protein [Photobacterium damselae subsp. piscicida]|uniref:antirestriction protein n=1 Tax=Photobacterium damselae TaxID=38293 RepID=UPI0010760400|nr:antirestriction protein [Photobacterium damselae]TFZ60111.1 antirestriction protein [Photobacterium damselae subsp. piscicida]
MITERIVPESERFNFFPSISKRYIHLEAYSYRLSELFIANYTGAYYEFIELWEDGSLISRFAFPYGESIRIINPMNYSDSTMSCKAAGIALYLKLYSDFANGLFESDPEESEKFVDNYHQLKRYALMHNESDKILAFID